MSAVAERLRQAREAGLIPPETVRAARRADLLAKRQAGPWHLDPSRRYCEWPASDVPLPLSRDDLRHLAAEVLAEWWGVPMASLIAADLAAAAASRFIEWKERGAIEELDTPENAIEGRGRGQALRSLAGTLRNRGLGEAEILACLLTVNDSRCRPPLAERELAKIARSLALKPAARPLAAEVLAA